MKQAKVKGHGVWVESHCTQTVKLVTILSFCIFVAVSFVSSFISNSGLNFLLKKAQKCEIGLNQTLGKEEKEGEEAENEKEKKENKKR